MHIDINILCDCGNENTIPVTQSSIIYSIEQNSEGSFHCLQNSRNTFEIVCVACGKYMEINYE